MRREDHKPHDEGELSKLEHLVQRNHIEPMLLVVRVHPREERVEVLDVVPAGFARLRDDVNHDAAVARSVLIVLVVRGVRLLAERVLLVHQRAVIRLGPWRRHCSSQCFSRGLTVLCFPTYTSKPADSQ